MKIEKIEEKKNKYLVTVNNDTYNVSLYLMTLHKINLNDNYSLDQVINFIDDALLEKFDDLLAKKLKKALTEHEVRTFLEINNAPYQIINTLIKRYEKYGYINDYQYILKYIETNKHKEGKFLIEKNLLAKGINSNLLNKFLNNHKESSYAFELASKKAKTIKNKSSNQAKESLYRFLLSKGFEDNLSVAAAINATKEIKIDNQKVLTTLYQKRKLRGDTQQVIITYLMQKGFKYDEIINVINNNDD